jgi:hypothetical protein
MPPPGKPGGIMGGGGIIPGIPIGRPIPIGIPDAAAEPTPGTPPPPPPAPPYAMGRAEAATCGIMAAAAGPPIPRIGPASPPGAPGTIIPRPAALAVPGPAAAADPLADRGIASTRSDTTCSPRSRIRPRYRFSSRSSTAIGWWWGRDGGGGGGECGRGMREGARERERRLTLPLGVLRLEPAELLSVTQDEVHVLVESHEGAHNLTPAHGEREAGLVVGRARVEVERGRKTSHGASPYSSNELTSPAGSHAAGH